MPVISGLTAALRLLGDPSVGAGSAVNLVVSLGPATPAIGSVSPNPASGLTNTFVLTYSDTGGALDLDVVAVVFNSGVGIPGGD